MKVSVCAHVFAVVAATLPLGCKKPERFSGTHVAAAYALGGLNVRERPDRNSRILTTIPELDKLDVLEFDNPPDPVCDQVDGLHGCWDRVRYKQVEGYAFGAFIAPAGIFIKRVASADGRLRAELYDVTGRGDPPDPQRGCTTPFQICILRIIHTDRIVGIIKTKDNVVAPVKWLPDNRLLLYGTMIPDGCPNGIEYFKVFDPATKGISDQWSHTMSYPECPVQNPRGGAAIHVVCALNECYRMENQDGVLVVFRGKEKGIEIARVPVRGQVEIVQDAFTVRARAGNQSFVMRNGKVEGL